MNQCFSLLVSSRNGLPSVMCTLNLLTYTIVLVLAVECLDYSAHNKNQLYQLITKCTKYKFAHSNSCDAKNLLQNFNQQVFNFRTPSEVERYAIWLKLMSRMQEYDAQFYLLEYVARHSLSMASVNTRISRKMQIFSADVYTITADLYTRYVTAINFRKTFASIQSLCDAVIIWDSGQFKTCLTTYADLRVKFEKNNKFVEFIDRAAVQTATIALEHPLNVLMSKKEIKQDIYMFYVSKFTTTIVLQDNTTIKYNDTRFKASMVENVEDVLFPYNSTFIINSLNVHIHHNISDPQILLNMRSTSAMVYTNFQMFYQRLGLNFTHKVNNVHLYVHNQRKNYIRTGPYWNYGVNNGGITQYVYDTRQIRANVFFLDYEHDKLPNAYGHEFHHCLLFSLETRNQPKWYIEGSADRFGNPECYERDHEGLKAYKNTTIAEITRAGYDSNILYSMGSALVAYLYEMRPSMLKSMIEAQNYTIKITDNLETEFNMFKANKIAQCDRYLAASQHPVSNVRFADTVQSRYMRMIDDETFSVCRNYIQIDFDDCAFILTPTRVIKQNRAQKGAQIIAQKEIRFNYEAVSQFDFEYLQKGMIKIAVKLMMPYNYTDATNIIEKYFSVDNDYWYHGRTSCTNDSQAIVKFARQSKFWANLPMSQYGNESAQNDQQFVERLVQEVESCQVYMSPPNDDVNIAVRDYVRDVLNLRSKISQRHLSSKVDLHNNTLLHIIAIYNHKFFNRLLQWGNNYKHLVTSLINADSNTPLNMYYYSKGFQQKFNKMPNRYCFTYVKLQQPSIAATKPTTEYSVKSTTAAVIIKSTQQDNIEENKEDTVLNQKFISFHYIVITIIVMVVGCIFLILINIATTIIVLKIFNNKINRQKLAKNNLPKNKYYTNDECIVRLFE